MNSFADGFSEYHKDKIVEEDHPEITFTIEWGSYMYNAMPLGLKNTPVIFSRILVNTFKDFIHDFLEVYLNDWTIFRILYPHIQALRLMFECC